MLIWANFDSFTNCISNISSLLQKFHFSVALNSFQTQKDLELVLRLLFLWNFSIIFFLL